MGLDLKFLDGFIHHPVFILKTAVLVAGLLGPIDTGVHIISGAAIFVGDAGMQFLGAGFVCVDGDVPALHAIACVGLFIEPAQALLPVEPFIHHILTAHNGYIMEAKFTVPVNILSRQFQNGIPSGRKIIAVSNAGFIGGIVAHDVVFRILHPEGPAS